MTKDLKALEHLNGLFDIVGKTVDKVTYAPPQDDDAVIIIHFTDGSDLHIIANVGFNETYLETHFAPTTNDRAGD